MRIMFSLAGRFIRGLHQAVQQAAGRGVACRPAVAMSFAAAGRTTADWTPHPAKTSRFTACRLATQSIDLGSSHRSTPPAPRCRLPHHSARHHGPECPLGFGTRVARLGLLAPRPDRPVLTKNLVIARMVRTFERQDLATHSRGSDFVRNHDPNRGIESFRQRDRLVVKARTRVNAV